MRSNGLVSIIMPVYQGQTTLIRALQSLFEQTYTHWECILIADDGFDYQHWLKQQGINDPRLKFTHTSTVRSGPNIARNVGKALAKGEWIAPLDADDLYYPKRLEHLLPLAQKTGLALDNVLVVDDNSNEEITIGLDHNRTQLTIDDFFTTNTPLLFVFHHTIAEHDWEPIARGGDTIFNLRALEKAGHAHVLPDALHEYRVHSASMCHTTNVGSVFDQAYQHTLERLDQDNLGFQTASFRNQVKDLIHYKKALNLAFENALDNGFHGDFQAFSSQFKNSYSLDNNNQENNKDRYNVDLFAHQ